MLLSGKLRLASARLRIHLQVSKEERYDGTL
jgi:hypothetical protein